jgi:hypothetical protein
VNDLNFPGPDTLCEDCGYPLKGLSPQGDCPECGLSIEASSPDLRLGPSDRDQVDLDLILRPKVFFRAMSVDGSNSPARWFMLKIVLLIGLFWLLWGTAGGYWSLEADLFEAGIVMASIYVLSYVEVLGVIFFARRRGWRVPFRLSERVVCYAAVGWIPSAIVMGLALDLYMDGDIDMWMSNLLGVWGTWQSIELLVLIGAVAMLWFELLVWLGVRQTKHANSAPPAAPVDIVLEKSVSTVET